MPLVLARLWSWIRQEPFGASYGAFSFGVSALATAPLRMIGRGEAGVVTTLAPFLFVVANLGMVALAIGTFAQARTGRSPRPPSARCFVTRPSLERRMR